MRSRSIVMAALIAVLGYLAAAVAAPRTAPFPGLREGSLTTHALVGGKIVVSPERTIEKGTIVVRDGVIVAVGQDVLPPAGAQVHDMTGKTLYAGFLDAYSELSADASRAAASDKAGAGYWNANIVPQVRAAAIYAGDAGLTRSSARKALPRAWSRRRPASSRE